MPTFNGPMKFTARALGTTWDGGRRGHEGTWGAGTNGNDWGGSPTPADLNTKFPNGTYTMTVHGT